MIPKRLSQPILSHHCLSNIEGLAFEIVEANLDDYHAALRKACLREAPHPPEATSDEMRDLVIWQLATRLAAEGGAVLLSRDVVHTHHRGDVDAQRAGLLRTGDFERALEILDLETASGSLVRKLLMTQWEKLKGVGLPLSAGAHIIYIKNPVFQVLESGTTSGTFRIRIADGTGSEIECSGEIEFLDDALVLAAFRTDDETYNMTFEDPGQMKHDYEDRLEALLATIGGDDEN